MSVAAARPDADLGALRRWALSPGGVVGLFTLYILVHFAVRFLISPTLGLDDAEQAHFAQQLLLGYRFRQPPLYTWLVWLAFEAFGVTLFALALVDYALLFIGYLFLYLAGRILIGDARRAALAAYGYLAIYVFAYYVHHDLTHTVAVGTMIAVSLYLIARAVATQHWRDHALLGAALAGGILAKYNFALFIAAAGLAAAAVPEFRRRFYTKRAWATLAALLAIVLPYLVWVYRNDYSFQGLTMDVVEAGGSGLAVSYLSTVAAGLLELGLKLLEFPMPFLVLAPLAMPQLVLARPDPAADRYGFRRFLLLHMLFGIALLAAAVVFFGATQFKARWFHPVLTGLPLYLFARTVGRPLDERRVTAYLAMILAVTLLAVTARLVADRFAPERCGSCRAYLPFDAVADELGALGFTRGTVVTDSFHVGGNLRRFFPESRFVDVGFPAFLWPPPGAAGQCLVVWQEVSPTVPPAIADYAAAEFGAVLPARRDGVIAAPYIGAPDRSYRLSYILIAEGTGTCR